MSAHSRRFHPARQLRPHVLELLSEEGHAFLEVRLTLPESEHRRTQASYLDTKSFALVAGGAYKMKDRSDAGGSSDGSRRMRRNSAGSSLMADFLADTASRCYIACLICCAVFRKRLSVSSSSSR
jgi:hypothetical protein